MIVFIEPAASRDLLSLPVISDCTEKKRSPLGYAFFQSGYVGFLEKDLRGFIPSL
jgi:hypothetical protein